MLGSLINGKGKVELPLKVIHLPVKAVENGMVGEYGIEEEQSIHTIISE
jgi:hypothetical protein